MNLLQALHRPRLQRIQQPAFKEVIRFLLALPVDGIVAVGEPIQESIRPVGRIVLRQRLGTLCIQRIRRPLLAVRRLELEVVSDTHELNPLPGEFPLEPAPVVTSLDIIILIVDSTDNIDGREPPFGMLLIPNGTDLTVIIEAYGFLLCHNNYEDTQRNQ